MRRRRFIALVAIIAVGWPLVAQAQRANVVRRIGVLTGASTPDSDKRLKVFVEELELQASLSNAVIRSSPPPDYLRFARKHGTEKRVPGSEPVASADRVAPPPWMCW